MGEREAAAPLSYRTQTPQVAEAELSQGTPRFTTDVPERLGLGFMEVLQESIPVYKALPPHPHPPLFFFLRTEEDLESTFFCAG